ncbi:hypothetical protein [Streptosporangium sp. NBC_01469]|uniref:hypothetical protein n=1 Tax=Streptosporangium sp. NBC_01469 TaxID=2903898 RepID=UPI002E27D873|nr:hypothetical protein [Streptosporangium sp. NBC_01469]
MPLKRRFARVTVSCAFAVAAVLSLGAFSPVPPSIPDNPPAPQPWEPALQSWEPAPQPGEVAPPPKPTVRALTAAEIREKGLDQYIDMSRQQETVPSVVDTSQGKFASDLLSPTKRPGNVSSADSATGCWYLTTTYGAPALQGSAYHTWCGDGVLVTYTSATCTGSTSLSTYIYEGCQNVQAYGVGWNVWDVTDRWRFCTAYDRLTGVCSARIYPWQKNRYGANGQLWLLGWGN